MLLQHEFILFVLWTVQGPSLTDCAWFTDTNLCSPFSKALKFSFGDVISKAFPVLLNPRCVCPWWLTSRAANLLKENAIMSKMKEWEKTEGSKDVAWMELEKWGKTWKVGRSERGKRITRTRSKCQCHQGRGRVLADEDRDQSARAGAGGNHTQRKDLGED